MFYDGQVLDWPGHGKFRASERTCRGISCPDESCAGESGPIPPGYYKVMLADRGQAQDDGRHACALKPAWGMQAIPRGTARGRMRALLGQLGLEPRAHGAGRRSHAPSLLAGARRFLSARFRSRATATAASK